MIAAESQSDDGQGKTSHNVSKNIQEYDQLPIEYVSSGNPAGRDLMLYIPHGGSNYAWVHATPYWKHPLWRQLFVNANRLAQALYGKAEL